MKIQCFSKFCKTPKKSRWLKPKKIRLKVQFLIYDNLTPRDIIMKITQEDNRQGKIRDNYFSEVVESYLFMIAIDTEKCMCLISVYNFKSAPGTLSFKNQTFSRPIAHFSDEFWPLIDQIQNVSEKEDFFRTLSLDFGLKN